MDKPKAIKANIANKRMDVFGYIALENDNKVKIKIAISIRFRDFKYFFL
jgi:hypothetical protein